VRVVEADRVLEKVVDPVRGVVPLIDRTPDCVDDWDRLTVSVCERDVEKLGANVLTDDNVVVPVLLRVPLVLPANDPVSEAVDSKLAEPVGSKN